MITYKLLNFLHGKNYCSIYPTIYFEKFLVDVLMKKVNSDKDMNFPKNPLEYYKQRIKKYINIKNVVEDFIINWPDKKTLIGLIQEKLTNYLKHLES